MSEIGRNAPCPCGSGKKFKACHLPIEDAQRKPQTGEDALIICMPTRGAVSHETILSIEQNLGGIKYALVRVARKPVAEARNLLAKTALDCIASNPFPFVPRETLVLWLDDDAWLPPGLVPQMMQAMREPAFQRLDALFAWFSARAPYSAPVAYRRIDDAQSVPRFGIDCKAGDVVPIEAAGFHCVVMRPRLLQRIGPNPFTPDRKEGEDFAFCRRAKAIGANLAVGTTLPAVHIDVRDGMAYMVGAPPLIVDGNELKQIEAGHLSVDGRTKFGEMRRYGLDAAESASEKAGAEAAAALQAEMEQRRLISAA